jgi:hypothetical protein
MYVNGKMRPVENITGIGRDEIKENGEGSQFRYDILGILWEFF